MRLSSICMWTMVALFILLVVSFGAMVDAHAKVIIDDPQELAILDVRPQDASTDGTFTYSNYIVMMSAMQQKLFVQGYWATVTAEPENYETRAIGVSYNVLTLGDNFISPQLFYADASDADYLQPGIMSVDVDGKFTSLLWGVWYLPIDDVGIDQVLIDPLDCQYTIGDSPFAVGLSAYYYKPILDGFDDYQIKIGPKINFAFDMFGGMAGSLEVAARWTNKYDVFNPDDDGGVEFQTRLQVFKPY